MTQEELYQAYLDGAISYDAYDLLAKNIELALLDDTRNVYRLDILEAVCAA